MWQSKRQKTSFLFSAQFIFFYGNNVKEWPYSYSMENNMNDSLMAFLYRNKITTSHHSLTHTHTHTHTHLHAYSIVCTYHAKSLTNKHIPTLSLALSITHTYINYDGMPPPLYLMYLLTHTYSYLSMCYLSIHLSIYLSIFP